jgi:hypothetical protein
MVLDTDDSSRGEIKMVSEQSDAARLVEELLESGVDVERIHVFDAVQLALKVAHRPVVSLGAGAAEFSADPPEPDLQDEPEPVIVKNEAPADDADSEAVTAEPLVRNGVKFSSLFKSDDV